ncbi:hypothetical protein CLAFUW4_08916 [Fulvia fulva]|nr:hypothetical protein CLAFUR4_08922 [Fulvia fulva]KAK4614423.1 hypothetical protein CLAFUR0_08914 [Fulvia fulva]WPV20280.1 hypothetical protein CLAFUW4_08916 [Fulvia fulva]WPV34868.1 hypothetical protein CLAFUW7_08917 [Fulvia fulva]
MAGTRSSANNTPEKAGTKRKATASSPEGKSKGRPAKGQKTLEETVAPSNDEDLIDADVEDEDMKEVEANTTATKEDEAPLKECAKDNTLDQVKADENEEGTTSKPEESKNDTNGNAEGTAVEEDKEREKAQPSNIMEKGIIYFFTRGRVGVEDPNSVSDIQRSFFVLRPLPPGGKLGEGAIQDVGNNRLIALPKKVWPKSGADKFMAFVEKAKASMDDLKETFFQGSTYSTKTTGTRHTPEVTSLGEGVYALVSSGEGRTTTHLAYQLTIPQELGDVQKDVGIAEKGSFVISMKNPEGGAPSYALPATAEYPKEILEEFGSLAWLPARPAHLDYDNAAFLLIGESFDDGKDKALEPKAEDQQKDDKNVPKEELEQLEKEDEHRIDALKGDDTIFEDLGISSKDYPKVPSTW